MARPFHTLDVFTSIAMEGNPLAVVLEADGLDAAGMQKIAREFNLSETVFVLEPNDPVNTARIRIFTPVRELPFAGHPIVGTAALLGILRAPQLMARADIGVVIEAKVGLVHCTVRHLRGQAVRASFTLPVLPQRTGEAAGNDAIAAALGLSPDDIGFDNHYPTLFSAGVPYTCVPLKSRAALAAVRPDARCWNAAFGGNEHKSAFLYTRGTAQADNDFATRMFFPLTSLVEDPATGSAAAAFAGVVALFDRPVEGDHTLVLEQGFDMGRPSLITLGLELANGELAAASIGGHSIMVMKGTLEI